MKDPTLRGYVVNAKDEAKVESNLAAQFDRGAVPNAESKNILGELADDSRVIDNYYLWSRNCTTIVCDAVNAGGGNEDMEAINPITLDGILSGYDVSRSKTYRLDGTRQRQGLRREAFRYMEWVESMERALRKTEPK